MRATVRDAIGAITVTNTVFLLAAIAFSLLVIELFGYLVWRLFPAPLLIITAATLGWKIGRRIGHPGIAKLFNAASVGLGLFGVIMFVAAIIDGSLFPERGYISWGTQITMWSWIVFHTWRAWRVLNTMPPDRLEHVTQGGADIYAEMTYRQARIKEALKDYKEATKLHFAAHA